MLLLLPDSEFALGLLILVGKLLEFPNSLVIWLDLLKKFDVGVGILVARVDFGVVR